MANLPWVPNFMPGMGSASSLLAGGMQQAMGQNPSRDPTTWKSRMDFTRQSGRSYLDPQRMAERYARWGDRAYRQSLAGGGGGGGGRGGGGGGQMMPEAPLTRNPRLTSAELTDDALVRFGNAPQMGMDYANSQAKINAGWGSVGDFGIVENATNPNLPQAAQDAAARQQYRAMLKRNFARPQGLLGYVQQAIYG